MPATVFLDVDGVISDIDQLSADFNSLIGDVLTPALGGKPADWGDANHAVYPRVMAYLRQGRLLADPVARFDQESCHLIQRMCQRLGVPAPDGATAAELGRRFNLHVRRNGAAGYGHAKPAIETLAASRDVATGNVSWNAVAVLEQIGVAGSIGIPAGTDLVGVGKEHPAFYERLFALARVPASEAVVVDDVPQQLAHAASLGADTVLVSKQRERSEGLPERALAVESIEELPEVVNQLEASVEVG